MRIRAVGFRPYRRSVRHRKSLGLFGHAPRCLCTWVAVFLQPALVQYGDHEAIISVATLEVMRGGLPRRALAMALRMGADVSGRIACRLGAMLADAYAEPYPTLAPDAMHDALKTSRCWVVE